MEQLVLATQVRGLVILMHVRCSPVPFLHTLVRVPLLLMTIGEGEFGHMLTWDCPHGERLNLIKQGAAALHATVRGNPYAWDGKEESVPPVVKLHEAMSASLYPCVRKLTALPWDPGELHTVMPRIGRRVHIPAMQGKVRTALMRGVAREESSEDEELLDQLLEQGEAGGWETLLCDEVEARKASEDESGGEEEEAEAEEEAREPEAGVKKKEDARCGIDSKNELPEGAKRKRKATSRYAHMQHGKHVRIM